MDCEKFDRVMLDLFYEELDEITSAAARRHTEHCTRCRDISVRLRATREVGALPLVDPPEGLEQRILLAERRVRAELPARQRFGRAISVLAGYAMRPQLAMAALLLLVIGSSLLLLRGRPGEQQNVLVTERGVPESEETVAIVPLGEQREAPREAPTDARALPSAVARGHGQEPAPVVPAPASAVEVEGESQAASRATEADRAYEEALSAYRD
ncbi:MAG TPA: zf-HC2 domain-containing protein, partial [Polyangiaceae bacterium]